MPFNALDIIIFAIIAISAYVGYRRGLLRAVYKIVSFFMAIFVAWRFYFPVARVLRETELFRIIQDGVANAINLEAAMAEHNTGVIDNLPIPVVLQGLLNTNNTPSMHELLQVNTLETYITGFFANMIINGIAILVVFFLTIIAMYLVGLLLDFVSMLPVIDTINRIGGFIFGLGLSVGGIWLVLVFCGLFVISIYPQVQHYLDYSWVAQRMFEITLPQLANVA